MSNRGNVKDKQDLMVREIIRECALQGEWLPVSEEFHSGEEMGFDASGVSVRAVVTFDKFGVEVNMTSPVKCQGRKDIYHRQQTFFVRNPPGASLFVGGVEGGPATQKCIDGAKDILIGLYSDWMILQSRKDSIRRRFSGFANYATAFIQREKSRVEPLRKRIRELSALSGQIKQRFRTGGMTQEDYIREKQPVHNEIVSLQAQAKEKDPFGEMFSRELEACRFVSDKRALIESIQDEEQ